MATSTFSIPFPKSSLIHLTMSTGSKGTGVALSDGRILQLKRNDVAARVFYDTFAAWLESYEAATMASMTVTAPPPKKLVNADLELMKKIYASLNIRNLNNMSRYLGTAIVHDELRRQMEETPEAERGGAKYKELRECITDLVTGYCYRADDRRVTYQLHKFSSDVFVKDGDMLKPIRYGRLVKPDPLYYCRWFKHMRSLYVEKEGIKLINYEGKTGTTFAECGVPLGPDGKPVLWIKCKGGAIVPWNDASPPA